MSINSERRSVGVGDEHAVDYLKRKQAENPSFFYAVDEQSSGNIFWVDSTFRMNYSYFGDTVRLDTSYKTNHPLLPLVSITGLNHHAQPILFGCGLLHYDSESAYVWLLQNWLHAMSGNYPASITTEPDHRISMAVAQVLPQTRHRFCRWSIFRETHEKLNHPTFDKEFREFIETVTVDEFESCWQALVERHSLEDNDWLQSLFNARHQWVPVYMQDTFFGEISPQENIFFSFFHGYVNATSMESLVKQYECAVSSWHEMEVKADLDTANTMPVLKTPSPMEKQAANVYTRRAFLRFQEQLVETLANVATKVEEVVEEEEEDRRSVTTYRVVKFEEQKAAVAHIVRLNRFEMKAVCSCRMFECSGIVCGHCLSVFRAENVLTLPSQYILKRWSRDARRGGVEERYESLRKEALKFVEEGAKSVHVYNVAQDALHLAANKVAATQLLSSSNQQTYHHHHHLHRGESHYNSESQGEKEKKIRELTSELEKTNERCQVYRTNLLAVLREMEEQKLKLSVKVQNARLTLKE